MKKLILLLHFVCAVFISVAQDEQSGELQTLFADRSSLGFYGSLTMGYSQIHGQDALVSGGRVALIFNHSTAVGLAGTGFVSNINNYNWVEEEFPYFSLAGGYGGIFIEPIVGGLKPVHVSFPIVLGMGGIAHVRNYGRGYFDAPYFDLPESDEILASKRLSSLSVLRLAVYTASSWAMAKSVPCLTDARGSGFVLLLRGALELCDFAAAAKMPSRCSSAFILSSKRLFCSERVSISFWNLSDGLAGKSSTVPITALSRGLTLKVPSLIRPGIATSATPFLAVASSSTRIPSEKTVRSRGEACTSDANAKMASMSTTARRIKVILPDAK